MSEWNNASLRERERDSIVEFLETHADLFEDADVLDLGCGRQPYRRLVERHGGRYAPYDRIDFPATVASTSVGADDPLDRNWDVILSTQVIQYVPAVDEWLRQIRDALRPHGRLVLTGPTNWPEVEPEDLWRFTRAGIRHLLDRHFRTVEVQARDAIAVNDIRLSLGWGAVGWR